MKNFEKITETPEALGAFLAALPVADGPWDTEFRRAFCSACEAENCDGANCPHAAERNDPLWWLKQEAALAGKENAAPESKPATVQGKSSTASATAAWKVMQALGYVNERPFEETQDLLKRTLEILKTLEGAGVNPEYWASVIGMAASFDVHMRG